MYELAYSNISSKANMQTNNIIHSKNEYTLSN